MVSCLPFLTPPLPMQCLPPPLPSLTPGSVRQHLLHLSDQLTLTNPWPLFPSLFIWAKPCLPIPWDLGDPLPPPLSHTRASYCLTPPPTPSTPIHKLLPPWSHLSHTKPLIIWVNKCLDDQCISILQVLNRGGWMRRGWEGGMEGGGGGNLLNHQWLIASYTTHI